VRGGAGVAAAGGAAGAVGRGVPDGAAREAGGAGDAGLRGHRGVPRRRLLPGLPRARAGHRGPPPRRRHLPRAPRGAPPAGLRRAHRGVPGRALLDRAGGGGSPSIAGGPKSPFEYVRVDDGRTVIKVTPEFLIGAVTSKAGSTSKEPRGGEDAGALCSTPELRKHYEQLVGAARGRAWSPRLDTIKERKGRIRGLGAVSPGRLSPVAVRLLGLDASKGGR